jgi:hypothetical protein
VPQTPQQQSALSPYRAPSIALVQPPAGGTVPQDRPVVVFRFVQGEPGDLVDARSFAVSVDGTDRSALFQLAASAMGGEAWGPLVAAAEISSGNLAPGAHQVTARICSARGACASANATVTVLPTPAAGVTSAASHPPTGRKQKLLDALIAVGKRLLREP